MYIFSDYHQTIISLLLTNKITGDESDNNNKLDLKYLTRLGKMDY